MIFTDLHTHTNYCDGKSSPEEMVVSAIEKGLKKIGVLVHGYAEHEKDCCVPFERETDFINEVNRLKEKYKDKIEVLLGVEKDIYSVALNTDRYDYVIGSMHYFKRGDKYYSIDHSKEIHFKTMSELFSGDYYLAAEEYFKELENVVIKTNADIIGHFDLISKFNKDNTLFDAQNERYIKAWQSSAKKLIAFGKPFEINTGGISRGYKTQPYPSYEMIKFIKENGGKFILSSDAHSKENIAFEFKKHYEIIKNL